MFLGEVIYKAERKSDTLVEVRAINYKVDDDEFNDTILDFRGNPQNSSMITKICEYSRRTEFIIKTLCDFIQVDGVDQDIIDAFKNDMDKSISTCLICNKNNNYLVKNTCCDEVKYCLLCVENIKGDKKERPKCPNCKKVLKYEQNYIENKYVKPLQHTHVIIMAHNLNILHYIYKKMVCKNLASVGYYIGGMSEAELKKSEKKQVTLNTEFLITPKTDIVQIVGRILRAKHEISHPIIYDFIDSHDLFQRQWLKRKAYYKKQNYKIIGTNSKEYNTDFGKWRQIYEPKNIDSDKCNKKIKKQISIKSRSSSDKSITNDSESDDDDTELSSKQNGKIADDICFLKLK
jgi:hypothetical protein